MPERDHAVAELLAASRSTIRVDVENIKMNQELGEEYEIPVPRFLIEHPRALVVIDGGNAAECAEDARGHWGEDPASRAPPEGSEPRRRR